jgi:hypothetical protein
MNRWKNYFSQLLNVHNVSDVGQIEVPTAEPLNLVQVVLKFKKYKSLGSDEIPAELIQAGGKMLPSVIH